MLKIDIHTHILPESWPDLSEKFGYGGFIQMQHDGHLHGEHCGCSSAKMMIDGKFFREVQQNCWSAAARLDDCKEHNNPNHRFLFPS